MLMIKLALLFGFGLINGGMLTVPIYRLPKRETFRSASYCPDCRHSLGLHDLVPILSYLWLKGRCRYCQAPISWSYPLVELVAGVLTVIWGLRYQADATGIAVLVFTYGLTAIAFIDLRHQIIPDRLTIPLILGVLVFQLWQGAIVTAVVSALAGGGLLWLVAVLYPRGMGYGDAKLLALIGLFMNWQEVFLVLFSSGLLGMIIMTPLILLKKRRRDQPFPFGPFLIAAAWIVIYVPESIIKGFFPI